MSLSKIVKVTLLLSLLAMVIPFAVAQGQSSLGSASVRGSANMLSDQLVISLSNVAALAEDSAYEGWLVSEDGDALSVGVLAVAGDGSVSHTYSHPEMMNLVEGYSQFAITIEPSPDTDPASSGVVVAADYLPEDSLELLRGLLADGSGSAVNLLGQTYTAKMYADMAVNARTMEEIQMYSAMVINIIEGADGDNFNGDVENPGDGMGIAAHAAATSAHAAAVPASDPTRLSFVTASNNVLNSVANVTMNAMNARDHAMSAATATGMVTAQAYASNTATLLGRAVDGWDTDRSGMVEASANEGGAMHVMMGAQDMASYQPAIGAQAPDTGDMSFTLFSLMALGAGAVLIVAGGAVVRRGRAQA